MRLGGIAQQGLQFLGAVGQPFFGHFPAEALQ
jgi:hypothetical protein